jgi:hypothetical protein
LTRACWRIRLGTEAEKDFARILKYTKDTFGERQFDVYKATLKRSPRSKLAPTCREVFRVKRFAPIFVPFMLPAMAAADDISSCTVRLWIM